MTSQIDFSTLACDLRQKLRDGLVLENEPMKDHTTFKIGGPARLFVLPESLEELEFCLNTCREQEVDYFILGEGSDLLVSDKGYGGVIISMENFSAMYFVGDVLEAQAGCTLKDVSEMACALSYSGLEFACGIPGSIGGACFMNAGAYGGCIADVLESVVVITADGQVQEIQAKDLDLGYRTSRIKEDGMCVVLARFALKKADGQTIRQTMDDLQQKRSDKQPLEYPSAGSTFKRPEGHFAGKLISDAGLQGKRIGGAEVSRKHAGFVVNVENASAKDVKSLISYVQKEVKSQFLVELEPEVRFLGDFS